MDLPLISIIIPAYNAQQYLDEAIESALNQTYPFIEVVVVNDGSTDRTGEIIKKYEGRVVTISQENKGLSGARNAGSKLAKGEYLAFLDADDVYLPEKIKKQYEFLIDHPQYDIVYCHMYHFYNNNPSVLYRHRGKNPSGTILKELLVTFSGQANTLLIPKALFQTIGLFDESYEYAEDWEFNLRAARKGYTFGFQNEPLFKMRITGEMSWSGLNSQVKNKQYHVRMFEMLSTQMANIELKKIIESALQKAKINLALAYLLVGNKKEAKGILKEVKGIKSIVVKAIMMTLPAVVIKKLMHIVWMQNRQHLLKRVM